MCKYFTHSEAKYPRKKIAIVHPIKALSSLLIGHWYILCSNYFKSNTEIHFSVLSFTVYTHFPFFASVFLIFKQKTSPEGEVRVFSLKFVPLSFLFLKRRCCSFSLFERKRTHSQRKRWPSKEANKPAVWSLVRLGWNCSRSVSWFSISISKIWSRVKVNYCRIHQTRNSFWLRFRFLIARGWTVFNRNNFS